MAKNPSPTPNKGKILRKGEGRFKPITPKSKASAPNKMWEGRFQESMATSMESLSFSLHFDRKLFREDIQGSLAHAKGLHQAGILTAPELDKMRQGLLGILKDLEAGQELFLPGDEDIHMAVERILTERIGALGKKLHTGRSRNDQVATDMKLYVRNKSLVFYARLLELQGVLYHKALEYQGQLMPGYTHLQQAQPVSISHYLLSFFFALERDKARLGQVRKSAGQMPLGSGALAGSAFPYDRNLVAADLDFPEVSPNSIDATSHRDFALEFLNCLATIGMLLSRHAEDFVIWSSQEFRYIRLGEAYTSGSSMMPQKRNPDSMELIRGKAGRLLGNYTRLFTVLKGLPLCYGRDLQEDKEPVFDSVETVEICLQVMTEAMGSLVFQLDEIALKMNPMMLATDLADHLAELGMPFRDAHHAVGSLMAIAEAKNRSFLDLSDEDWSHIPGGEAIRRKLDFAFSVDRRNIEGGTGRASVKAQLAKARRILSLKSSR